MTTRNKSVTGKEADSYYQFDDLPVRVFIDGKGVPGRLPHRGHPRQCRLKPGNYEAQTSDYLVQNNLTAPDYLVDQWNPEGLANVRGTSSFAYRYGPETFPLVRSQVQLQRRHPYHGLRHRAGRLHHRRCQGRPHGQHAVW